MPNEIAERTNNNPFSGGTVATRPSNAIAGSDQQRAIAEVQAAMMIARMNPRDPIQAMDRILQACTRPTLAAQALYSYNRGGSDVTGPSIRLAEAIAQSWGNFQFGIRELEQRNGESTVEAFAWDIETNTRQVKVFQVPHIRFTRKGSTRLEDPRDIYEMVANQGARRLRACILGVIPGDVIEGAVKQAEQTMITKAEVTPERIKSLLEKFAEFGVTKEQLEKRIQRHLDAMTPALMVNLGKIYNSLKDGMSVAADWFEATDQPTSSATTGNDALKQQMRARQQSQDAADDDALTRGMEGQGQQQATQDGAPTLEEAIAFIKKGDEESIAIAREIGDAIGKRDVIDGMIANRQAPAAEQGQQQDARPRGRRG